MPLLLPVLKLNDFDAREDGVTDRFGSTLSLWLLPSSSLLAQDVSLESLVQAGRSLLLERVLKILAAVSEFEDRARF